jgi:hypothetical protein
MWRNLVTFDDASGVKVEERIAEVSLGIQGLRNFRLVPVNVIPGHLSSSVFYSFMTSSKNPGRRAFYLESQRVALDCRWMSPTKLLTETD